MSKLEDLIAKRNELDAQIEAQRSADRKEAIAEIRKKIELLGLKAEDLFSKSRSNKGSKVEPNYLNPNDASQTWTGRGKPPAWIANEDREKFLIA